MCIYWLIIEVNFVLRGNSEMRGYIRNVLNFLNS